MQQLHPDDVIWRNARLATMIPDDSTPYGLKAQHATVVRGQTILAVIPESDIPSGHRHCVDLHGRLVTPGLIDCHTHLVFGGDRAAEWEQRLNGVSYQTISAQGGGINATVTATRSSSPETLLRLAQQRLQRLIDEGVTTVEIKSGYGLNAEAEEKMLQVARQLGQNNPVEISPTLLAAHAVPAEYRHDANAYLTTVCEQMMPTLWQKAYSKPWMCFAKMSASRQRKPSGFSALPLPRGFRSKDTWNSFQILAARRWSAALRGFPPIILNISTMTVFRRWRTTARLRYYCRGRSIFFRNASVRRLNSSEKRRSHGCRHRL